MKTLLLTGYGLYVSVKNTRLVFKQGYDLVQKQQQALELPATVSDFDKVVMQGKGYVSTQTNLPCLNLVNSYILEIRVERIIV